MEGSYLIPKSMCSWIPKPKLPFNEKLKLVFSKSWQVARGALPPQHGCLWVSSNGPPPPTPLQRGPTPTPRQSPTRHRLLRSPEESHQGSHSEAPTVGKEVEPLVSSFDPH